MTNTTTTTTERTFIVPELESHCGSWIVVSRETGKPVLEIFERSTAEAVNQRAYEVLTTHQWLVRFDAAARRSS